MKFRLNFTNRESIELEEHILRIELARLAEVSVSEF